MNQYETPENAAQFEANNEEFLSQDLLDVDERWEVAQRFPQVVAKLPNIPMSRDDSTKKPKKTRRQTARKVAVLLLVFSLGVGVGALKPSETSAPNDRAPNASSQVASEVGEGSQTDAVGSERNVYRQPGATEFVASTSFTDEDFGRLPGDDQVALYPDLDSDAFSSRSFDGGAAASPSYRPNNPFALDYSAPANAEKPLNESPRVDETALAPQSFNGGAQDYPTWDDLELPADSADADANANVNEPRSQGEFVAPYPAYPTNAVAEGAESQQSNRVVGQGFQDFVGQGFQDFQPYGETNDAFEDANLAAPNAAPQAPRQEGYSNYSDKAKFIGYQTQTPQDFLANNVNYAGQNSRNDYNSNVGQFNMPSAGNSNTVETNDQFNVAGNDVRASAEYVARNDAELERQSVQSNQPNPAPAPVRSLRW